MNFKKIMLITLLLAVLTIGAVSAADDVDVLAVDDAEDEAVVEAPVEEDMVETPESGDALGEVSAEDFNVIITDDEIDVDDEDATVVSFVWPENATDNVIVDVEGGSGPWFEKNGDTSRNIKLSELYIWEAGEYNLTVTYGYDMILAKGTLKVIETFTADDFIELYDGMEVADKEAYVCTACDSTSESGLNGTVTVYVGSNKVFTKKFNGTGQIAQSIYAKDLSGNFNGNCLVKLVYAKSNGTTYSKEATLKFNNIVNGDPIKTTIDVSSASVSMAYGANKVLIATLKDSEGKPISGENVYISVMGMSYPEKTDSHGQVKLSLANLPPKTHYPTFTFKDTGIYKGTSKKVTVKVTKATPKITAKAKTFKSSDKTKKYTITLNVKQKVKVTVKVNKKTYTAYTNTKGQATFKLTKLTKKGKYAATVNSVADNYFNKAKSVNVKITVK